MNFFLKNTQAQIISSSWNFLLSICCCWEILDVLSRLQTLVGHFHFPQDGQQSLRLQVLVILRGGTRWKTVDERFLINRDNLKKIVIIDVYLKILCRDFSTLQCKPAPLPPPLLGGPFHEFHCIFPVGAAEFDIFSSSYLPAEYR